MKEENPSERKAEGMMMTPNEEAMEAAELEFLADASGPGAEGRGPREQTPKPETHFDAWSMMDVAVAFRQGLKWTAEVRREMERDGFAWADDASDIPMVERWLARNPDFRVNQGETLQPKEVAAHFRRGRTWGHALKKAMEEAGWQWAMGMIELGRVEMFLGHYRADTGHDFGQSRVYASRRGKGQGTGDKGKK